MKTLNLRDQEFEFIGQFDRQVIKGVFMHYDAAVTVTSEPVFVV